MQGNEQMIGVVAGTGPFAGLDLLGKIVAQTAAQRDQDHLAVASLSAPAAIPDRTAFLLGETPLNPGVPIAAQLLLLEQMGARVAGIPCNTAHAPAIFTEIEARLATAGSSLTLLHMIAEVGKELRRTWPDIRRVGVLSTVGTAVAGVYPRTLEPLGYTVLIPAADMLAGQIHAAIYDKEYGIKACGRATERARADLLAGVIALRDAGAQAVILGCTEIPIAVPEAAYAGIPLLDSALILARALIRAVDPARLRPWPDQKTG